MRNYPYSQLQINDISTAILFGISSPSNTLYGASEHDTRNAKEAHKRLYNRGFYERREVGKNVKSRYEKRDILTTKGFEKFIEELPNDDPLKKIENSDKKISVRNGLNGDNFIRLCRQADAQCFFHSVGVDSPYTLIKNYNANPFLFGHPECSSDAESITIADLVKKTLVEYVQSREQTEYPLAYPDSNCPTALFLPNLYNPKSKVITSNDIKVRAYNNAVGILFDFPNRRAYAVFKQFGRKTQKWMGKAYQSWLSRCGSVMKRLGIINADPLTGSLSEAIFLCDTNGELLEIAKQSEKMRSPFNKVIPILANQEGADTLGTILVSGLEQYENDLVIEISRNIKEAKWVQQPNREQYPEYNSKPLLRLRLNGIQVVNGTLVNFRWLGDMKNHLKQNNPLIPYVACYESQRIIYEDIVGLPRSSIIIIPQES